jgi:hypothetical protein
MALTPRSATRKRLAAEEAAAEAAAEAARPKLLNLADDLLLRIAASLNAPSSVLALGAAASGLRSISLHGSLWRQISFPSGAAQKLTDEQLDKFLTLVNAREYTHTLSLVGCCRLMGTGLAPLHGTEVLRSLDFRTRLVNRGSMVGGHLHAGTEQWLTSMLTSDPPQLASLVLPANLALRFASHALIKDPCCASCVDVVPAVANEKQPAMPVAEPGCFSCNTPACHVCTKLVFKRCYDCFRLFCPSCMIYGAGTYVCEECADDDAFYGGG